MLFWKMALNGNGALKRKRNAKGSLDNTAAQACHGLRDNGSASRPRVGWRGAPLGARHDMGHAVRAVPCCAVPRHAVRVAPTWRAPAPPPHTARGQRPTRLRGDGVERATQRRVSRVEWERVRTSGGEAGGRRAGARRTVALAHAAQLRHVVRHLLNVLTLAQDASHRVRWLGRCVQGGGEASPPPRRCHHAPPFRATDPTPAPAPTCSCSMSSTYCVSCGSPCASTTCVCRGEGGGGGGGGGRRGQGRAGCRVAAGPAVAPPPPPPAFCSAQPPAQPPKPWVSPALGVPPPTAPAVCQS